MSYRERFFAPANRGGAISIYDGRGTLIERISKSDLQAKVLQESRLLRASRPPCPLTPLAPEVSLDFITRFLAHMMAGHVPLVDMPLKGPLPPEGQRPDRAIAPPFPAETAYAQRSSGTTGAPKLFAVTFDELARNVDFIAQYVLPEGGGVATSWLPFYHDMGLVGMLLVPLLYEVDLHLFAPRSFLRAPALWLDLCAKTQSSISYGPSAMWRLAAERYQGEAGSLSHLKIAGIGGDTLYTSDIATSQRALESFGLRESAWLASYGMAEAVLALGFRPFPEGVSRHFDSGQQILPSMRLGPQEADVHLTAEGQIAFAGRRIIASVQPQREQIFLSPDLGQIAQGDLYVSGRAGDFIKVNGRKIFFADVEDRITALSGLSGGLFVCAWPEDEPSRLRLYLGKKLYPALQGSAFEDLRQKLFFEMGIRLSLHEAENGFVQKTTSGKIRRRATFEILQQQATGFM